MQLSVILDRHIKIFRAVVNGEKYKTAAASVGLTRERARQVVFRVCRILMCPNIRGDDEVPDGARACYGIKGVRDHKDFWLAQLAKFDRMKAQQC